jgi:apolipoprotein N-acyltransferase
MRFHRLIAFCLDILSVLLSAALLTLIFPPAELNYLAWVALVPVLLLLRKAGPLRAFLCFLATGFLFYSALIHWTLTVEGVNPFNFYIGNLATACFIGVFGLAAYYFRKNNPRWTVLTFPAAWAILEFLKTHLGFLSVPWGTLGYSQYSVPAVAGFSAYTGVYGVSFLIVAVNTALADVILYCLALIRGRDLRGAPSPASLRTATYLLCGGVIVVAAYSLHGLSHASENLSPALKVAIVQGNIYSEEKATGPLIEKVVGKYRDLTLQTAPSKPDLIAWPSSSVPGRIPFDRRLVSELANISRKTGSFLLAGTSGFDKFNSALKRRKRIANSAFLFSPQGRILGQYDKIRLLPFDEYLPLRGHLRWPSWIISPGMTDHEPGEHLTVFKMRDGAAFGVQICWENLFPDQFRKMAAKGVDFMVSMTNEGFVGLPVAHHQLLAMNAFRAIENHVAIVRTAATGVSCVIEPDGRIIARVSDPHGNDANIEGVRVARISLSRQRTFYTRFGDLFIAVLSVIIVSLVLKNSVLK